MRIALNFNEEYATNIPTEEVPPCRSVASDTCLNLADRITGSVEPVIPLLCFCVFFFPLVFF